MLVAHISDLHFGRLTNDRVVGALVADINAAHPDVVVISGDLTQRSRKREWAGALEMIAALNVPPIIIPGNHDVFAWWFPLRRLFAPLRRYRRVVQRDLDIAVRSDDMAIVALNAAFGWTVKGGRFRRRQSDFLLEFMKTNADARFKVLVVHHPLLHSSYAGTGDVARGSRGLLQTAVTCGVDCVMDGHLHRTAASTLDFAGRKLVHVTAGTATSDRGRFEDTGRNVYNRLEFVQSEIRVFERVYDLKNQAFVDGRSHRFARRNGSWSVSDAS